MSYAWLFSTPTLQPCLKQQYRGQLSEKKKYCAILKKKSKKKKKKKMEPIGSVLANSYLGHDILNIPNLSPLPNSETCLPFVLMGDDAFG